VRDTSKGIKAKSSEQNSAGLRKHLDNLIGRMVSMPAARRRGPISITDAVSFVADAEHPENLERLR
jgi:hypothetical protein